jgi:transcriptional regulator with XRE-family HTH domain
MATRHQHPKWAALCDEIHNHIGFQVRELRGRSKWKKQEALASAAGIATSSLRALEKGAWNELGVTLGQLCKIATALGVELVVEIRGEPVTNDAQE